MFDEAWVELEGLRGLLYGAPGLAMLAVCWVASLTLPPANVSLVVQLPAQMWIECTSKAVTHGMLRRLAWVNVGR
jgi:hypothetical protein